MLKSKQVSVEYPVCDICEHPEINSGFTGQGTWLSAITAVYTVEDHGRERDYNQTFHLCRHCAHIIYNFIIANKVELQQEAKQQE